MPLKTHSNCSDPASDNSTLEEDVFLRNDEIPTTSAAATTCGGPTQQCHSLRRSDKIPSTHTPVSKTEIPPPPPPYSVAINRHWDTAPATSAALGGNSAAVTNACANSGSGSVPTTISIGNGTSATGIRFTQQQLPELDDVNARAGILPAARARLASLKSLGTKKLNAIKMRLSDNRHKLEDCK